MPSPGVSSIGSAAVAHLALALPLLDWDCNITSPYLVDDLVERPVVDGHIVTPEGPGLGVAVDEDQLARPDDLVDQAGGPGQDEDREDRPARAHPMKVRTGRVAAT